MSATMHRDEQTPHMHLIFLPIVHTTDKKGNHIDKLACSEFWKAKDSYRQLQDAFYNYMVENGFDNEWKYKSKIKGLEKENNKLHRIIDKFHDTIDKFIHWIVKKFDMGAEDNLVRDFERENHIFIDAEKQGKREDREKN